MCDYNNGYKLLEEHFGKDVLDELFLHVGEWASQDWKRALDAQADVKQGTSELVRHLSNWCTDNLFSKIIPDIVERQVLQILNNEITSVLHREFKESDESFFEKCREFNESNLTAAAFGPMKNSMSVQLSASIVEMANLDSHTDPNSKLECLVSCFDLIYAELKMAIAEEIADTGKENEIPIVDNADIHPFLMCVIVKGKPRHFFSNLEYIKLFCRQVDFNNTTRYIYGMFERAAAKIFAIKSADVNMVEGRMRKELNQSDLNELMMGTDGWKKASTDKSLKRVTRQIFASLENI